MPRKETPSGGAGRQARLRGPRRVGAISPTRPRRRRRSRRARWTSGRTPPSTSSPRLEKNPSLTVFVTESEGQSQGRVRPNSLHPPFNNKKARQALLYMVDQQDVPPGGDRQREVLPARARAIYMCGRPVRDGGGRAGKQDLEKRQAAPEGERVRRRAHRAARRHGFAPRRTRSALVTARAPEKDRGQRRHPGAWTGPRMVARRAKKDPPRPGRLEHLRTPGSRPPTSIDARGQRASSTARGEQGLVRLAHAAKQMEKLRTRLGARARSRPSRKKLAEQIQTARLRRGAACLRGGSSSLPSAFRKNVKGVLEFGATILWNIQV